MKASAVPAAAIAPQRAAQLYDVAIIGEKIQDSAANFTRFAVLSKTDHPPTGNDRTSMCLSLRQDLPGSLYHALGVFARRGINLTKIESRPTKETLGRYIFLIDCEGHREDPVVEEALTDLRRQVVMLNVLGSYPRWDSP